MPGSSITGKLQIIEWFNELKGIKSVLDIGPGWATYAKLLSNKNLNFDAVEVCERYVKLFNLNKYYKSVYNTDICDFVFLKKYDVVILGDILEHLSDKDTETVLKKILNNCRYCLVSLPLDAEAGVEDDCDNSSNYWQNSYEKHLTFWSNKKFINFVNLCDGEIIGLKKFSNIAVYLLTKDSKNYLTEKVSLLDKLKHRKLSFDVQFNLFYQPLKFIKRKIEKII
jgi:2-polyprenyl-3-methyl-5-hydroxy-6-metoxy-1,4-benzoquinol methylase